MDEVYISLTNKTTTYKTAVKQNYDKIIIVSGFSKY